MFPAFGQQNTSGGGHKDFHENLSGDIILRAAVPQKKHTASRISNQLNNELSITVKVLLTLKQAVIIAIHLSQCDYGIRKLLWPDRLNGQWGILDSKIGGFLQDR